MRPKSQSVLPLLEDKLVRLLGMRRYYEIRDWLFERRIAIKTVAIAAVVALVLLDSVRY